jgi:hypothetical protein
MKNQDNVLYYVPCFVAIFNADGARLPHTERLECDYVKHGTDMAGGFQYRRIDADSVIAGVAA